MFRLDIESREEDAKADRDFVAGGNAEGCPVTMPLSLNARQ